jgi:hypothetical protein
MGDIAGLAIADRRYDSGEFRRELKGNNNTAVIHGWKNRKKIEYGQEKKKKRGLIQRIFEKLEENRRLAVRYDKSDIIFLGFILIAFLKILLF